MRKKNIKRSKRPHETLSDDQKRAAYDQYGPDGANGFGGQGGFGGFDGGAGFGGFEDIFSSFFGGGATVTQMLHVKVMTFSTVST